MRILLDQVVHDHRNNGNNALLEIAMRRLERLLPDASLDVLSTAPHLCRVAFRSANPVSPDGIGAIPEGRRGLLDLVPPPLWRLLFGLRDQLQEQAGRQLSVKSLASAAGVLTRVRSRHNSHREATGEESVSCRSDVGERTTHAGDPEGSDFSIYNLYVATGGGYLCDFDKRFLYPLFDRIERAVSQGVPVVMVGQGVGAIRDPELRRRAREVLPSVDLILIRERELGMNLLESLGVPAGKVVVTGDDAIELAYEYRASELGSDIGVSLRVADYTEVETGHIATIRTAVQQIARRHGAALVGLPIDVNDRDRRYIAAVLDGYPKTCQGWLLYESTADVLRRVRRCRVVVSGTYHGAVFALSQGIPVVAVARSEYQTDKVEGLASEFGRSGCQVVRVGSGGFASELADAIDLAWESAGELKPELLRSAERQIGWAREGYARVGGLARGIQPCGA